MPGIERRRRGRGFVYLDPDGTAVTNEQTLARIRSLAIPPAWRDVWISSDPNGHLQATGVDAAGRKQYRYHDRWRTRRDQRKFEQMLDFARALPRMRRRVAHDLGQDDFSPEQVLACAVRLLDLGSFRIGSEQYVEENESYGLATIRKDHVHVSNGEVVFDYAGKSGQRLQHRIADAQVHAIVDRLRRRRDGGEELLAYRRNGGWVDLGSADVNEYLKTVSGGDFTAKDFRTWNATLVAALSLAEITAKYPARSRTARKRVMSEAVKRTAFYLGNTPAVCRAAYIDPRVFDRYQSGWTVAGVLTRGGSAPDLRRPALRREAEEAVIDLIEEPRESPVVEKTEAPA
jgi:DNA topoisomerase I